MLPPTVLVSAARSMVTTIVEQTRAQDAEGSEVPVIERLLVRAVVGLLFNVYPHLDGVDGAVSDIERAHALILTNLRDPGYTGEQLAQDLTMSRRQVQRLFARFDSTPTETMRLTAAGQAVEFSALDGFPDLEVGQQCDRHGGVEGEGVRIAERGRRLLVGHHRSVLVLYGSPVLCHLY